MIACKQFVFLSNPLARLQQSALNRDETSNVPMTFNNDHHASIGTLQPLMGEDRLPQARILHASQHKSTSSQTHVLRCEKRNSGKIFFFRSCIACHHDTVLLDNKLAIFPPASHARDEHLPAGALSATIKSTVRHRVAIVLG